MTLDVQLNDMGVFRSVEDLNTELCKPVAGITGPEDIQMWGSIAFISADYRYWYNGGGSQSDRLTSQVRARVCVC